MPEDIQKIDMNDGKLWSEMDVTDLKNSLTHGNTIEQAAIFLCRSAGRWEVSTFRLSMEGTFVSSKIFICVA